MTVLLLLANLAATGYMTGLIWFVQVVHYPLFNRVGEAGFARYEADHGRLTSLVVGPPMLIELATALALVVWRPTPLPAWWAWTGLALVGVIWLSTVFLQVPQHGALAHGFSEGPYRFLVSSNWVRTLAWSVRMALLLWAVHTLLVANASAAQ